MVESKKLGRRIVDAVSMFIVTAMSLLLLLYVGYGEGRRTYEQIELEKLTAQGYLIQNTIEKFLRDDLPLKQFPGFATIARPLVDGLADVDAMTVYDHDRRELFVVKDKSDPKLPPVSEAVGRVKRDIEIDKGDTHYQVVVPLRTRFETAGALVIMSQGGRRQRTTATGVPAAAVSGGWLGGGIRRRHNNRGAVSRAHQGSVAADRVRLHVLSDGGSARLYADRSLFRRRERQGRDGDVHLLAALQRHRHVQPGHRGFRRHRQDRQRVSPVECEKSAKSP